MGLLKKKKGNDTKISSNEVCVIIKGLLGGKTPREIGRFKAIEENDENYNLVLRGDDGKFKENIDNVKHDIIDYLKYKLDLNQTSYKEKIQLVKDKIIKQENKIRDIEDGYHVDEKTKIKTKVNLYDEEDRLRHYKTLLFSIENEGDGSYIELLQDGTRQITFLSQDGILTPYFMNAPKVTMYPDIGSKRKLYRGEQLLIDQELKDDLAGDWGNLLKWAIKIIPVVILVINIFWSVNLMDRSSELDKFYDESYIKSLQDKWDLTNIKCADYYAQTMEANVDIINHYKNNLLNDNDVKDTFEEERKGVQI